MMDEEDSQVPIWSYRVDWIRPLSQADPELASTSFSSSTTSCAAGHRFVLAGPCRCRA